MGKDKYHSDGSAMPPPYNESERDDPWDDNTRAESSRTAQARTEELPMLTPDDIVIAVMGVTGVGKSTFISYFNPAAIAGDDLESCTTKVEIFAAEAGGKRIYLIDTPGFDDTRRNDTDILREVADWLNRSYQANIKLSGIIYLHRIGDVRMTGAGMKNLRMFKKLCGQQGLAGVVLATTMWSNPPNPREVERETQLRTKEDFWAGMIAQGSRVFRQDNDAVSATKILEFIIAHRYKFTMKIQEEMASGKTLGETAAGQEVQAEIEKLKAKHENEMRELREEMRQARINNDVRTQQQIQEVRAELERKIQEEQQKQEKLRVTMEELQRQREEERERAFEQQLEHEKEMLRHEAEISQMKAANDLERRIMRAEHEKRMIQIELEEERRRKNDCVIL